MDTFKVRSLNFLPVHDPLQRKLYYTIATGDKLSSSDWFQFLRPSLDVHADPLPVPSSSSQVEMTVQAVSDSKAVDDNLSECNVSVNVQHENKQLIQRFDHACDKIKSLLSADCEGFAKAIQSFCHHVEGMSTASGMQSALMCFGKYSGAAAAHSRRYNLTSCKRIGVQPTAIARRKMIVGGRKYMHMGRPSTASFDGKQIKDTDTGSSHFLSRQLLPKRRAPHSLAAVVSNNESLGRTHSAK
jgi:hypothetical protein